MIVSSSPLHCSTLINRCQAFFSCWQKYCFYRCGRITKDNTLTVYFLVGANVGEEGGSGVNQEIRYALAVGDGERVKPFELSRERVGFEAWVTSILSEPFDMLGKPTFFLGREPSRAFEKIGRKLYLHR